MYIHNFMVQVMTPKPFLVIEDVTIANSTFQMCNSLKIALQKRKLYMLGMKHHKDRIDTSNFVGVAEGVVEGGVNTIRRLNRRDGSGNILAENEKTDYLWIHPKESKNPRSLQ